jgi:hypothetical protein
MLPSLNRPATWRCVWFVVGIPLAMICSGCASAAMMGGKVVGHTVDETDVDGHSKRLLGQAPGAADAEFPPRVDTLEDIRTRREMITYPVKGDILHRSRWVVEVENNRIVALAKLDYDADGGKDAIRKAVLRDKVIGKTPQEVQSDKHFQKITVILRNRSTGNLVRVYDIGGATDLLGARYCLLDFDKRDRCTEIRLAGVPASAGTGIIKR